MNLGSDLLKTNCGATLMPFKKVKHWKLHLSQVEACIFPMCSQTHKASDVQEQRHSPCLGRTLGRAQESSPGLGLGRERAVSSCTTHSCHTWLLFLPRERIVKPLWDKYRSQAGDWMWGRRGREVGKARKTPFLTVSSMYLGVHLTADFLFPPSPYPPTPSPDNWSGNWSEGMEMLWQGTGF